MINAWFDGGYDDFSLEQAADDPGDTLKVAYLRDIEEISHEFGVSNYLAAKSIKRLQFAISELENRVTELENRLKT